MSEKFWLWAAGIAFCAVVGAAMVYAIAIARECERHGGVMVRSFSASGWSCLEAPLGSDPPRRAAAAAARGEPGGAAAAHAVPSYTGMRGRPERAGAAAE